MPNKTKSYDKSPPRVFIRTFGCQMNEADSELVYGMLMQEGYKKASSYEDADIILFNTCSVRKHAEDRVWGKVGQLKSLKGKVGPIIGIIGCMAKAHGKEIFKKLPHVNFICGPSNIYEIVDLIQQAEENKIKHFSHTGKDMRPPKRTNLVYREEGVRTWVNISYGCNNFCSYCIVPYVRGRLISRPVKDIIDEVKALADDGCKEITLLGQNVNSYAKNFKKKGLNFVKLLEEVNKIEGLERIRFMTSHPKDAHVDLFKAMSGLDKVCEHLHLPMQSGSDRILRLMNRGYRASDYLKLVKQYHKIVKRGSLTTDIIVGFPTEKERNFYKTYLLMKEIKFDNAFIFKYSPRPYTKAFKMEDDVDKETKNERNQILLNLQRKITTRKIESLVGTKQQALGISKAKRKPNVYFGKDSFYVKGRIRTNQQVVYDGHPELVGSISEVEIKNVEEHTLIGERV